MIQKGIFRVCFSIILKEKSEQDTLESKTLLNHHLPPPSEHVQKFIRFGVGMLPLPFPIFKRPGVFIHCRSAAQFHIIRPVTSQYRIAIFQIWGGKWQCSLFSDKGVATTMCAADAAQVLLIPAAAGIKVQYDSLFLHNVFFLATLPQTQIGRHTQIGKVHLHDVCRLSSLLIL